MSNKKGVPEPNYTQVPNDLFDKYLADMGRAELKVVLAISRMTFGYHRDRVRISLSRLVEMTGLSRASVLKGAEEAEKRGLITKLNDGGVTEWVVNLLNQFKKDPQVVVKKVNHTGKESKPVPVKVVNQTGEVTIPPSIKESNKENKSKEKINKKAVEEEPPKSTNPTPAADSDVSDRQIMDDLLLKAGVMQPKRSQLLDLEHVTPEYVRAHCAVKGVPVGLLIHKIEYHDPAPAIHQTKKPPKKPNKKPPTPEELEIQAKKEAARERMLELDNRLKENGRSVFTGEEKQEYQQLMQVIIGH